MNPTVAPAGARQESSQMFKGKSLAVLTSVLVRGSELGEACNYQDHTEVAMGKWMSSWMKYESV